MISAAVAMLAGVVTQAASDPVVEDGSALDVALRYGVTPVLVLVLLLTKRLWTDGAYQAVVERAKAAEARAEKLETKVDDLNGALRDQAIPALVTATATVGDNQAIMARLAERFGGGG